MTLNFSAKILDVVPRLFFGTLEHRVAYLLRFQCIAEGRRARFTLGIRGQEIGHLVDETVLVTDAQTGHPPLIHVGHVGIRHMHRTPASDERIIAVIEVVQSMQIVQVQSNRRVFAIDFKGVQSLVASRVSS